MDLRDGQGFRIRGMSERNSCKHYLVVQRGSPGRSTRHSINNVSESPGVRQMRIEPEDVGPEKAGKYCKLNSLWTLEVMCKTRRTSYRNGLRVAKLFCSRYFVN